MTDEEREFCATLVEFTKEFTAEQHAKLGILLGQAHRWGRESALREVNRAAGQSDA